MMTDEQADRFMSFFLCPTTKRVIDSIPGDDKVICHCGTSNPLCPTEANERTNTHIVRFLERSSAKAHRLQREKNGDAL